MTWDVTLLLLRILIYVIRKHFKLQGYVEEVYETSFLARCFYDDYEFNVEFFEELVSPSDLAQLRPGSLFTFHITKAGDCYLYYPKTLWTKRQVKKIRKGVRELKAILDEQSTPTEG